MVVMTSLMEQGQRHACGSEGLGFELRIKDDQTIASTYMDNEMHGVEDSSTKGLVSLTSIE